MIMHGMMPILIDGILGVEPVILRPATTLACGQPGITCDAQGNLIRVHKLEYTGGGHLPTEIGLSTLLEDLTIAKNNFDEVGWYHGTNSKLSGTIPTEIGLLTKLKAFHLGGNRKMSGTLPTQVGNLELTRRMIVSFQTLSGTIPSEIGRLTNIDDMLGLEMEGGYWRNSPRKGITFSGTIPSEIGLLSLADPVFLNINSISGTLPTEVAGLKRATFVQFYQNLISGTIPSEVGEMSKVGALHLMVNRLSGTLPTELAKLSYMSTLSIKDNPALSGTIPEVIARLPLLTGLDTVHTNVPNATAAFAPFMSDKSYCDVCAAHSYGALYILDQDPGCDVCKKEEKESRAEPPALLPPSGLVANAGALLFLAAALGLVAGLLARVRRRPLPLDLA